MAHKVFLITFSGLDGSGKSTQIANLRSALASWRKQTKLLAFWDHAVTFTRYREGFVHKVYKSERGIGAPGRPVQRRDKNVRRWYLTVARHALYLMDAWNLRRVIRKAARGGADVIVMDRYIYDELANLPLDKPFSRRFARYVSDTVPKPDAAFILDADPEAAVARKPEYSVEFASKSRASYMELARFLGNIEVIPPLSVNEARLRVTEVVAKALGVAAPQPKATAAEVEQPHAA